MMDTEPKGSLGDRMKAYEMAYSGQALTDSHIMIRLDGKGFSRFTKRLIKPFDKRLTEAMVITMNHLLKVTDAKLGYTQSDEISLYIPKPEGLTEVIFGARIQKLVSLLASEATVVFNAWVQDFIPEKQGSYARFDCRVWTVPTATVAADAFKWRMQDCVKNSVSMTSHHIFGHKESLNKNTDEKIAALFASGFDWHKHLDCHKFGTFAEMSREVVPIPDEVKHFPSNAGKAFTMRSVVRNFSLTQFDDIYFTLGVQNEKRQ